MSGKEKGKQMHDGKTSAIEKLQNLRSYFVHKIHFTCLERAIDIKINTLPRVLYSCLALHKQFELQKQIIPEQGLSYKRFVIQKSFE